MKHTLIYSKAGRFLFIAGTVVLLFFITSCDHDRNHPGWAYAPDMAYSEAYDAYSENPNFSDSMTMQEPVEGTIPRGKFPYPYKKTFEDQTIAGQELVNPLEVDDEILSVGKEQYNVFCANCHGYEGKGDGHLYTSKFFTAKPTSLVEEYVLSKPDGEIYHVITLGSLSTLMGAHGSQIKAEDRWKIIHYIKHELANK